MTLKDKMILYVYHKGNELELDMYENMRSEIRINAFNEFVQDLFKIIMYCDTKPPKSQNK